MFSAEEFYVQVEQLLSAPPPTFDSVLKKNKKGKDVGLSELKRQRAELRRPGASTSQTKPAARASKATGRKGQGPGRTGAGAGGGGGEFDYNLLAQVGTWPNWVPFWMATSHLIRC